MGCSMRYRYLLLSSGCCASSLAGGAETIAVETAALSVNAPMSSRRSRQEHGSGSEPSFGVCPSPKFPPIGSRRSRAGNISGRNPAASSGISKPTASFIPAFRKLLKKLESRKIFLSPVSSHTAQTGSRRRFNIFFFSKCRCPYLNPPTRV